MLFGLWRRLGPPLLSLCNGPVRGMIYFLTILFPSSPNCRMTQWVRFIFIMFHFLLSVVRSLYMFSFLINRNNCYLAKDTHGRKPNVSLKNLLDLDMKTFLSLRIMQPIVKAYLRDGDWIQNQFDQLGQVALPKSTRLSSVKTPLSIPQGQRLLSKLPIPISFTRCALIFTYLTKS